MTRNLPGAVAEARQLWRHDRALLLPVSALPIFLPQYAALLLIPPMPASDPATGVDAWERALEPWVASYGGWYVLATLMAQFGALSVLSLYMPPQPPAGAAMARAARLFPRVLLAGLLVTFPGGVLALLSLSVPALPLLVLPALVYALARTALAAPVILAERGTGAVAAVIRSWRLTRGRGLAVAALVGAVMLGGQAGGALLVRVEQAVRASAFANPVLIALVDAGAAAVTWGAALALALIQVVLYRRLARQGI